MTFPSLRSLLAAAVVLGAASFAPGLAAASCAAHPTLSDGRYVNVDPETRSITAANLRFVCGDLVETVFGGTRVISGGDPHWTVRLWGSCSPRDCDWGAARAEEAAGRGSLLGAYDQGFARRDVSVVPDGAHILVIISTTYTDGRAPRTSVDRMRPL